MAASRVSSDEGDIFYVPVSAAGAFVFHVPAGSYSVHPASNLLIARTLQTSGAAGERIDVRISASLRAPAPDEVVKWLAGRALPIATTELRPANDDLAQLAATTLVASRVIGIGEATHGTREYFRIKHRLLERFVAHHGLTALAMEANFSDAERVDAFVQTGQGTAEEAMKSLVAVWAPKRCAIWSCGCGSGMPTRSTGGRSTFVATTCRGRAHRSPRFARTSARSTPPL